MKHYYMIMDIGPDDAHYCNRAQLIGAIVCSDKAEIDGCGRTTVLELSEDILFPSGRIRIAGSRIVFCNVQLVNVDHLYYNLVRVVGHGHEGHAVGEYWDDICNSILREPTPDEAYYNDFEIDSEGFFKGSLYVYKSERLREGFWLYFSEVKLQPINF